MSTIVSSGSITTTASAQDIAAPASAGSYILFIDCNAMAVADEIEVVALRKARAADPERVIWRDRWRHDQTGAPLKQSPVIPAHGSGCRFTIQRLAGTDRAIPWTVETP